MTMKRSAGMRPGRSLLLATALSVYAGASGCHREAPPPAETNFDPLSHAQGLAPRDLADRYPWLEFHPLDNSILYFRMRAPRDFKARPGEISSEELRGREGHDFITLAEVGPPSEDKVFIRVSCLHVPGGMGGSLAQHLEQYLNGYLPGQIISFDPKNPRSRWVELMRREDHIQDRTVLEELIEVASQGSGPSTVRLQIGRAGDLVFVITCSAPSARFESFREAFAAATGSFRLLNPSAAPAAPAAPAP